MDYFFLSFPIEKKYLAICLTNTHVHAKGKKPLNQRDFYKFLWIMILITSSEFTSKAKFMVSYFCE